MAGRKWEGDEHTLGYDEAFKNTANQVGNINERQGLNSPFV
ncbi:MAG: hypothetical protein ABR980_08425 [Ignavibacteriaceae bacterium]|jgi:hypothetical protein